ncbi:hypothetical protein ACH5RR_023165, partial [Cinchona calisaya]
EMYDAAMDKEADLKQELKEDRSKRLRMSVTPQQGGRFNPYLASRYLDNQP